VYSLRDTRLVCSKESPKSEQCFLVQSQYDLTRVLDGHMLHGMSVMSVYSKQLKTA
jgi:hypothetical protein